MGELYTFGRQLGDFVGGVLGESSGGPTGTIGSIFQRDVQAENEVRAFLAELRRAFDEKNLEAIVAQLADDFTTFELTPAEGDAVRIDTKAEAREYLASLFPPEGETQSKELGVSQLVAASNLGFVTEEGDVVIRRPDGTKEHQPLRATAVAARTEDGWRWLHWHMSELAPRFRVDADGNRIPFD